MSWWYTGRMYEDYFDEERQALGTMLNHVWREDPKRLAFVLARYHFVARMLEGKQDVAEIGCSDGWAGRIVEKSVGKLDRYDNNLRFCEEAGAQLHDILISPLRHKYDAVYALDVIEHLHEPSRAITHMASSTRLNGVVIIGMPSLESQKYASIDSKKDHVSCMTEQYLRWVCNKIFSNVFIFGMNDTTLHTGFGPMCHYRLALCIK